MSHRGCGKTGRRGCGQFLEGFCECVGGGAESIGWDRPQFCGTDDGASAARTIASRPFGCAQGKLLQRAEGMEHPRQGRCTLQVVSGG
jgi:hypothetical protein